ncbi:Fc.00g022780.m01.CDS01 [Cosmosporella sp. VM-42]
MRFSFFTIALGLATSVFAQGNNFSGQGNSPENPLYVDVETDAAINPALFPANTYLTTEQTQVFEDLVFDIITAQENLAFLAPASGSLFQASINEWTELADILPNYQVLREVDYLRPLDALRIALLSLEDNNVNGFSNVNRFRKRQNFGPAGELKDILTRLLLDNLFLAGFFNDVYDGEIIPSYMIDQPGEVIGILTRFLAIDVNEALDLWPGRGN